MPVNRVAIVCRDCGEVSHVDLAGVRPGALVRCTACGLVVDPRAHAPAFQVGGFAGPQPGPARAPRRGTARLR